MHFPPFFLRPLSLVRSRPLYVYCKGKSNASSYFDRHGPNRLPAPPPPPSPSCKRQVKVILPLLQEPEQAKQLGRRHRQRRRKVIFRWLRWRSPNFIVFLSGYFTFSYPRWSSMKESISHTFVFADLEWWEIVLALIGFIAIVLVILLLACCCLVNCLRCLESPRKGRTRRRLPRRTRNPRKEDHGAKDEGGAYKVSIP